MCLKNVLSFVLMVTCHINVPKSKMSLIISFHELALPMVTFCNWPGSVSVWCLQFLQITFVHKPHGQFWWNFTRTSWVVLYTSCINHSSQHVTRVKNSCWKVKKLKQISQTIRWNLIQFERDPMWCYINDYTLIPC